MILGLTEYKLIFKSYADCLDMFLVPAKQNGNTHTHTQHKPKKNPCHVTHMVFDLRGRGHM